MNDPIRPHADEGLINCVWDYTTHRSDTLPQRVFFFLPSLARAPHCHRYCPRPQRWCVSDSVSPSRSRMRDEQRRTIYYFLTNILDVQCEKTRSSSSCERQTRFIQHMQEAFYAMDTTFMLQTGECSCRPTRLPGSLTLTHVYWHFLDILEPGALKEKLRNWGKKKKTHLTADILTWSLAAAPNCRTRS